MKTIHKGLILGLSLTNASYANEIAWQGVYITGNFGAAWSNETWTYQNVNPYDALNAVGPIREARNHFNLSNFSLGPSLGYNLKLNTFLISPEISWYWIVLNRTLPNNAKNVFPAAYQPYTSSPLVKAEQFISSNRTSAFYMAIRFGKLLSSKWLLYGKSGYTYTSIRTSGLTEPNEPGFNLNWSSRKAHNGWLIGGGVEYALTPRLTLGFEYNYSHFNPVTHIGLVSGPMVGPLNQVEHQVNTNLQNTLMRVTYLFGEL